MTEKSLKNVKKGAAATIAALVIVSTIVALKHSNSSNAGDIVDPIIDIDDERTPLSSGDNGQLTTDNTNLEEQVTVTQAVAPAPTVVDNTITTDDTTDDTTDPVDPVDPADPVEDPADPVNPVDPVDDPTNPVNPVDPVEDPANPVNPVDPVEDPADPEEPVAPVYSSNFEQTQAMAALAVEFMAGADASQHSNDNYRAALSTIMNNQALTLDDVDLEALKAHLALTGNEGILSNENLYLHVYFVNGTEGRTPIYYVSDKATITNGNTNRWAAMMVYADGNWYVSTTRHSYDNSLTGQSIASYYSYNMSDVLNQMSDSSKWVQLGTEPVIRESEDDFARRCINSIVASINGSTSTNEYFAHRGWGTCLDTNGINWAPALNAELIATVDGLADVDFTYHIWKGNAAHGYDIFWTFENIANANDGDVISTIYKYNTATGTLLVGTANVSAKTVEGRSFNVIKGETFQVK